MDDDLQDARVARAGGAALTVHFTRGRPAVRRTVPAPGLGAEPAAHWQPTGTGPLRGRGPGPRGGWRCARALGHSSSGELTPTIGFFGPNTRSDFKNFNIQGGLKT